MKRNCTKKAILALAAIAAAGTACAQSSVTLFGVVDATLAWGRGQGPGSSNRMRLADGSNATSRVGFRGTEDLGGGLKASFWLEAGINEDSGLGAATNTNNQASGTSAATAGTQGLTFNRRSFVSLSSGVGELRLGRDYSAQYWNLIFDPFNNVGVGASQTFNSIITGPTAARVSNAIMYFLPPNIGGIYGQAHYYAGENLSSVTTSKDGNGVGVRLGYASGPFDIAAATSRTRYLAGDVHQSNVGGSWDFKVAKLMGHISKDKNAAVSARGWLVGAIVPVGVGEVRAAYSQYRTDPGTGANPTTKKIAVGYVHSLSKRTVVYTTYARLRNSGGAAAALNLSVTDPNNSSSGLDIGIRHSF